MIAFLEHRNQAGKERDVGLSVLRVPVIDQMFVFFPNSC